MWGFNRAEKVGTGRKVQKGLLYGRNHLRGPANLGPKRLQDITTSKLIKRRNQSKGWTDEGAGNHCSITELGEGGIIAVKTTYDGDLNRLCNRQRRSKRETSFGGVDSTLVEFSLTVDPAVLVLTFPLFLLGAKKTAGTYGGAATPDHNGENFPAEFKICSDESVRCGAPPSEQRIDEEQKVERSRLLLYQARAGLDQQGTTARHDATGNRDVREVGVRQSMVGMCFPIENLVRQAFFPE